MRLALCALMLAVGMACDAPGSGPSLPSSAHWVTYALASYAGPVARSEGILAATSLATIQDEVVSAPKVMANGTPWPDASHRSGVLYVAVATYSQCTRNMVDNVAVDGHSLFYVHWIGHPSGVCNAAMALPRYRLYAVPSGQLPRVATLDVKLLVEDAVANTDSVIAEVSVQLG